ncbi:DUF6984 family protein [Xenophilus aerolatus]|nr:hypothetical protein [Xenophilus aerolatus]
MRPLFECEIPLMRWLISKAQRHDSFRGLTVGPMDDGQMGSLRIGLAGESRRFGRSLAEAEFEDRDGTLVIATLNADSEGQLFELDVWRVDFSPLQRWPAHPEIRERAS